MSGYRWSALHRLPCVVHAVLYLLKTGNQSANFPKDFPPKSTIDGYFRAGTRDHVIESIHFRLRALIRADDERRCLPMTAILDSYPVRSACLVEGACESVMAWIYVALIWIMLPSLA